MRAKRELAAALQYSILSPYSSTGWGRSSKYVLPDRVKSSIPASRERNRVSLPRTAELFHKTV
jgi:hypothetical protein